MHRLLALQYHLNLNIPLHISPKPTSIQNEQLAFSIGHSWGRTEKSWEDTRLYYVLQWYLRTTVQDWGSATKRIYNNWPRPLKVSKVWLFRVSWHVWFFRGGCHFGTLAISGHVPKWKNVPTWQKYNVPKWKMFRHGKWVIFGCSDMAKACSVILKLVFKDLFNQKAHKVKTFFKRVKIERVTIYVCC